MASLSVAAIVVSHGKAELLAQSLEAVASQTHPLQQVVVVETANDERSIEIARSFGFAVITPGDLRLGAAIEAGINSLAQAPGWIWLIHDDLVAHPDALEQLAKAAEISPSVALIGPKLLQLENPIQIQQMGLTATKSGRPFLLVQEEYDQGQHDKAGDTLSISTAGMLFSLGVWQEIGGLDDSAPVLAQDLEFGARARLAGYRVVIEASAKMRHAGLAMNGERPKRWLGGSVRTALSRAHLHFATLLLPLPLVILTYLLLPVLVLVSVPLHLIGKQPSRILSQFLGWLWAWGTFPKRLAARRRFRSFGSVKPLKQLLSTNAQVRLRRRAGFEAEPELDSSTLRPGLFRSNSAWFALLPLLAAVKLFPQGAIGASGYVPLGPTFDQVFASVSSGVQPYLSGTVAPNDPFSWVLLFSAALSPANPSLGFAALVFASPLLAFLGAWQLAKQLISKPWVITLLALGYALSPQLLMLQGSVQARELLASAVLPWGVNFALRAFGSYNSARAWRWTGVAGLVLALQAALSPTVFGLVAILVIGLGFARLRRFGILIWSLLPGVVLLGPWVLHIVESQNYWLLTLGSSVTASPMPLRMVDLVTLGALALIGSIAWFFARPRVLIPIWLLSAVSLAASWYQPLASSRPLLLAAILGLLLALGLAVEAFKPRALRVGAVSLFVVAIAASVAVYGPLNQIDPKWSESRVMPALVVAASEVDASVRTLVINSSDGLQVDYVWGGGQTLERKSSLVEFEKRDEDFANDVALASANLVAGNAKELSKVLESLRVDFVLVNPVDPKIANAIGEIEFIQPAGYSEFGALFRVENPLTDSPAIQAENSFLKWQLGTLAAFGLLAIPTRASIRGYRRIKRGGKR